MLQVDVRHLQVETLRLLAFPSTLLLRLTLELLESLLHKSDRSVGLDAAILVN